MERFIGQFPAQRASAGAQFDEAAVRRGDHFSQGVRLAGPPSTPAAALHAFVVFAPGGLRVGEGDAMEFPRQARAQAGVKELDHACFALAQQMVLGVDVDHRRARGGQFAQEPRRRRRLADAGAPALDAAHRQDVLEAVDRPAEEVRLQPARDVGVVLAAAAAPDDGGADLVGIDDVARGRGRGVHGQSVL
ncbi:hypothetical protein [Lysobacter gummosus]|uniref:hypothetical protein n=1 Tax=Lysobacter gummosus TaxID=262324 RepID=UPI00363D2949